MRRIKRKNAVVVMVVAVLGAAVGFSLRPARGQTPAVPKATPPPAAGKAVGAKEPPAATPGTLLLVRSESTAMLTPQGKKVAELRRRTTAPDWL
jgi:hypothetical protein